MPDDKPIRTIIAEGIVRHGPPRQDKWIARFDGETSGVERDTRDSAIIALLKSAASPAGFYMEVVDTSRAAMRGPTTEQLMKWDLNTIQFRCDACKGSPVPACERCHGTGWHEYQNSRT